MTSEEFRLVADALKGKAETLFVAYRGKQALGFAYPEHLVLYTFHGPGSKVKVESYPGVHKEPRFDLLMAALIDVMGLDLADVVDKGELPQELCIIPPEAGEELKNALASREQRSYLSIFVYSVLERGAGRGRSR